MPCFVRRLRSSGMRRSDIETAVKAQQMGLMTSASASDVAKAAGVKIPGNRIVGVFRNDFARRMLNESISAGIEAPIRFYVTENMDGTATLSYKKPTFVFAPYFEEGGIPSGRLQFSLTKFLRESQPRRQLNELRQNAPLPGHLKRQVQDRAAGAGEAHVENARPC